MMGRKRLEDMTCEELIYRVKRLRKEKRRLKERLDNARRSPDWIEIEGSRGGSFVRLQKAWDDKGRIIDGMARLEVGETCVVTVQQEISIAALAIVLTAAKDRGFQKVVDEYLATPAGSGCPAIRVEADPAAAR